MSVITVTLCLLACIATVLSRPEIKSKIVGGKNAELGQFPHQVSLRRNNKHFCGGSIISPLKVLTAAHCIINLSISLTTAVVGTNTLNSGGTAHPILNVSYHESYDPRTEVNDVGVVNLALPILYNQYVQPINLATSSPSPGETVTLSGWGTTSFPGDFPNDLQYINLQTLDLETCAQSLQGASPITTAHVCTNPPEGEGACFGDSGGPLITAEGVQAGIVSWGVPCARGPMADARASLGLKVDFNNCQHLGRSCGMTRDSVNNPTKMVFTPCCKYLDCIGITPNINAIPFTFPELIISQLSGKPPDNTVYTGACTLGLSYNQAYIDADAYKAYLTGLDKID